MPPSRSQGTSLTIWDHLALLLRWRRVLMIYLLIMAVLSVSYAFLAKKWYVSEATVLPPPANKLGLANLIPGLAGGAIGMGALQGDDALMLMSILESRALKDSVINKFDWMSRFDLKYRIDAYKRFKKKVKWEVHEDGYFTIYANEETPEYAAETVNYVVDLLKDQFAKITISQARTQRKFVENRLNQNYADLAQAEERMKEFQKRTGVILMEEQVTATVDAVSKLYGELVLAEVRYDVLNKTLPASSSDVINAKQNVLALRKEIKRLTESSDNQAQSYLINLEVAPDVGMEYFRLERDIKIQSTILEFLLPQYEQAKIQEMRDKSELYVLDPGFVPEKKTSPKRALIVISWMFLSFVVFYFYAKYVEYVETLKEENDPMYQRIHGVLEGVKPRNFFRRNPDMD